MDTLFHAVFGFIAGMAVNAKLKHRVFWVAIIAVGAVLIDVDHFIFAYPRTFHNVFITVLLPALLFAAAYRYERGRDSIKYQSLVILLFVMLNGHLVADMFGSDLRLMYPLSTASFGVPDAWQLAINEGRWGIISPDGIAFAVYAGIIALAYYAEEFIYFVEKQNEPVAKAINDLFR